MAIERQTAAALRLGQAAQTVAALDRLTAEQPLREEAWQLLALDDWSRADSAYQDLLPYADRPGRRRQRCAHAGAGRAAARRSRVSAPPGTRTPNPQIKSLLLCQLS
jgi:hypothetical protein